MDLLWSTSGGNAGLIVRLWAQWARAGLFVRAHDGRVHLIPDADRLGHTGVHDTAMDRLRGLFAGKTLPIIDKAARALSVGAMQGERFTADAVADALDFAHRDELVNLFDNHMTVENERPEGLLVDAGHDAALWPDGSTRHLCTYRFAGPFLWIAFREGGLVPNERARLAGRLDVALREMYGDVPAWRAALARISGDAEAALEWRSRAERGGRVDDLRWRAHLVLTADRTGWDAERCRWGAMLLVDAVWALDESAPPSELVAFGNHALDLAQAARDQPAEAHALRARGSAFYVMGDWDTAIENWTAALALFDGLGQRSIAANVAAMLAEALIARRKPSEETLISGAGRGNGHARRGQNAAQRTV